MIVLQVNNLENFKPGNELTWKETSQWSGYTMERKGIIQSISKAQSGCYFVQLDKDRTVCLELIKSL